MVQSQDDCGIRRRLSAKGQVSLPGEVRKALSLRPGDSVIFEITDGAVSIRRADSLDPFFNLPLFQALEEWSQDQKATVFRYPLFSLEPDSLLWCGRPARTSATKSR